MARTVTRSLALLFAVGAPIVQPVFAEVLDNDDARMAKKLANKIEPIVNVPLQFNFYQKAGPQHQQYQEKLSWSL